MLAVENTLISESILEKKFVCDLNACKGECCVAGDSGAPLEKDELPILDSILEKVKPYMVKNGVKAIEKHGAYVIDGDGDYTTTLVSEGAECAFVFFDENKIAKCAIEQAYREGKINWQKPISCHLYPIRISKLKNFTALNYHYWKICKPACDCGNKLDVPVYKFLKEPLIRKFGEKWYKTLVQSAEIYLKK
ncbi:MAG: DUF3109 family protein [Bacteroidetes bacterium]|nr:DUF3109 family protein [Bacteroidota bacterium]